MAWRTFLLFLVFELGVNVNTGVAQHYVIDKAFGEECGLTSFDVVGEKNPLEIFKMADGKYLMVGDRYYNIPNAVYIMMARFNADGTVDTSFGTDGVVLHTFNQRNTVDCVVMDNDKIYVSGIEAPGNGGSSIRAYVARFNLDGTPDVTFNETGRVVELASTNPISGSEYTHILVQPDGKIVAFGKEVGNINGGAYVVIARRYNEDGSVDATFHPSVTYPSLPIASEQKYSPGLLDEDGSMRFVYLTDGSIMNLLSVKLDASGELVSEYGVDGLNMLSVVGYNGNVRTVYDGTGSVYVQIRKSNSNLDIHLVAIDQNGDLDPSFSDDGIFDHADLPGSNGQENGYFFGRDSQGRLWSMGESGFAFGAANIAYYRIDEAGNYDMELEGTGYGTFPQFNYTSVRCAYFEGDDEIVLGLITGGNLGLAKMNTTQDVISLLNSGTDTLCTGDETDLMIESFSTCYNYQWQMDGADIGILNESLITVSESGSYQVVALDGADTLITYPINIVVEECVNIEERNGYGNLNFYPNPSHTQIYLDYSGNIHQLEILNLSGEVVRKQINPTQVVNVENLAHGIYFIRIQADDKWMIGKLVVE